MRRREARPYTLGMSSADKPWGIAADAFKRWFPKLIPLILQAWPSLDEAELRATEGDLEAVIALLAGKTGRTKIWARQQLDDIMAAVDGVAASQPLKQFLDQLEQQVTEATAYLRRDLVKDMTGRMQGNVWVTVLVAIGLGFVAGFLVRGSGRER